MADLEIKKILIEESLRKNQMSQIFDVVKNEKMVFFRSLQLPYVSLSQDFNGDVAIDLLRTLYHMLVHNAYDKFEEILGESMYNQI